MLRGRTEGPTMGRGRQTAKQTTATAETFQASQPRRHGHSNTKNVLEEGTLSSTA